MFAKTLANKLQFSYQDPLEEQEYTQVKMPLLKNFFTYLLICMIILLVPLIMRFFYIGLHPQAYMALGMLILAVLLFSARNVLGKWMEYIVVAYLLALVLLIIFNLAQVLLSLKSCESFYGGYAFALLHRILGYRVVKIHSMFVFHIISLGFRLIFLYDHDLSVNLTVSAVEVVTLCLGIKSELGERALFDSLYKSKKQLEKFKDFLTEHLPNQMAIFSRNFSEAYFMNRAIAKSFRCEDMSDLHSKLDNLIVERETLDNDSYLAPSMECPSKQEDDKLTLSRMLNLLSKSIKGFEMVTFQVFEDKAIELEKNLSSSGAGAEGTFPIQPISPTANKTHESRALLTSSFKPSTTLLCREHSNEDNLEKKHEGNKGKFSEEQPRRIFKVKVFLLPWDGADAIAVVLDDITQQRTIMELQIADKNKDLVIATVSHELRTPLTGMLGLIDITKKQVADKDVLANLNACKNSGTFLLSLVNSILDLSQIKNNKLRLVYTEVSLVDLLSEVKSLFEPFCTPKSLYLKIDIAHNVPKVLMTDRSRLTQILINLLGNAFKFTFEGGVTIKVSLDRENTHSICFSIQDTGLGIKKEDQEKLFKLFGRLEQLDKKVNTHGVGLGLTISNTLAALLDTSGHRGICVESEVGKGSAFSFVVENQCKNQPEQNSFLEDTFQGLCNDFEELEILPLERKVDRYATSPVLNFEKIRSLQKVSTQSRLTPIYGRYFDKHPSNFLLSMENSTRCSATKIDQNTEDTAQTANKGKIRPWCLVVDDNPFNIIVASHIVEEKGYRLKKAMNGKEAINEVKKHHDAGETFQFILMDCQMPVMNGFEATKKIKKMMKAGEIHECPIIALTANNRDEEHDQICREVGMDGCVSKPLNMQELGAVLQRL